MYLDRRFREGFKKKIDNLFLSTRACVSKNPVTLHCVANALARRFKLIQSAVRSPEKSFIITPFSWRPCGDTGVATELPMRFVAIIRSS